jgi:hypothetical protein
VACVFVSVCRRLHVCTKLIVMIEEIDRDDASSRTHLQFIKFKRAESLHSLVLPLLQTVLLNPPHKQLRHVGTV